MLWDNLVESTDIKIAQIWADHAYQAHKSQFGGCIALGPVDWS